MEILTAMAVGVFLMVAWTVGGWLIVRMGFDRDRDAAPHRTPGAPAVHPGTDPNAAWRAQMKAATAASGAVCACPQPAGAADGRGAGAGVTGADVVEPSPDCPIHRWDFA
ncbi:hypothetical protein V3N95_02105 [Micrococcaceae bacterium Sec6.3]